LRFGLLWKAIKPPEGFNLLQDLGVNLMHGYPFAKPACGGWLRQTGKGGLSRQHGLNINKM